MVRRTSKKSKRKKKVSLSAIESVMRRVDEFNRITRQEVIEPLPDPEGQLFDPMNHTPARPMSFVRITGHCTICKQILTEDYPEDFPEEYKFCCHCHSWAVAIIRDEGNLFIPDLIRHRPLVKKIYERMVLQDGESKRIN